MAALPAPERDVTLASATVHEAAARSQVVDLDLVQVRLEAATAPVTARFSRPEVRVVDVCKPVEGIADPHGSRSVRILVVRGRHSIGEVIIENRGGPLTGDRIRQGELGARVAPGEVGDPFVSPEAVGTGQQGGDRRVVPHLPKRFTHGR